MKKKCKHCNNEFIVYPHQLKNKRGKFCSRECWRESLNKTIVKCEYCNNEFQTIPAKIKKGKSKYCSRKCYEYGKVDKFSDRIKKAWITRRKNGKTSPWNKGKKFTQIVGENNHNWKGGKWKYWKTKALERDNYTCVKCGFNDKRIISVDHIKPKYLYPELKYNLDNLMSLCPNCHSLKTLKDRKNIAIFKKNNKK